MKDQQMRAVTSVGVSLGLYALTSVAAVSVLAAAAGWEWVPIAAIPALGIDLVLGIPAWALLRMPRPGGLVGSFARGMLWGVAPWLALGTFGYFTATGSSIGSCCGGLNLSFLLLLWTIFHGAPVGLVAGALAGVVRWRLAR